MRGLRTIALRELTRRKARYALTALGIVLGVANVFGVLVTNATTNASVLRRAENFAGGADVIAQPSDYTVPLESATVSRLLELPGVRAAAVYWQGFDVDTPKGRRDYYTLGAADDTGRSLILSKRLVRGRLFRAGRPEAVVSRSASRALHLSIGDEWHTDLRRFVKGARWDEQRNGVLLKLRPGAPTELRFRITGIINDEPSRGAGYPRASYTSLEYVRSVMAPNLATEVRFFLKDSASALSWASERSSELPEVRFDTATLPSDFRRFLSVLQGAMSGAAAIAVFVGAFLIYLTFSMAVVERTRTYGMLHAVGSTSGQVARAVLREAVLLGVLATSAGLVLGALISLGLLRIVAGVVQVDITGLTIPPFALIASIAVGLVATIAGSLLPARRASRVSPVQAIRGTQTAQPRVSRAWIAGVVLLAAGVGFGIATRGIQAPSILAQLSTLAVLFGAVLLVPPLLGAPVRAARGLIRKKIGGLGDVAAMHLIRERSRSAYTLGLVMVVLAMMLALAATSGSVSRSVTTWVDKRFGADLLAYNGNIPPSAERTVAAVPAVRAVTSITFGQVRMTAPRDLSSNLVLIDPVKFFAIAGFPWAEGNDASVKQAFQAGGAVLLPANLAQQIHVLRGGHVTLLTRHGPAPFDVAGVYAAFGAGNEIGIVASFADAGRFFVSDRRNVLYINFAPATPRRAAVQAVDAALVKTRPTGPQFVQDGPYGSKLRSGYFFTTGAQNKADARRNVRSYFTLFYAVLFVAVVVGLLGLANTMATSVIHRFRELGVLGAVGASPEDIRRMVLAEAAVLVGTAFVLSLALGTLLARLLVDGVTSLVGFHVDFVFPWGWIPILGVLAVVIAFTAALAPARRAARLTPVEALRYE